MKDYVLLFASCFLPALAGILVSRPLWRIRRLPNEVILVAGQIVLICTLILCLVPLFFGDNSFIGFACIVLSLLNIVIFQYYEHRLHTSRCPQCHTRSLRIRRHVKGLYKLYCPHCGLHSQWRNWRYFSNEG